MPGADSFPTTADSFSTPGRRRHGRRSVLLGLAAAVAAGCSTQKNSTTAATRSGSDAATQAEQNSANVVAPAVDVSKVPAALRPMATAIYTGGTFSVVPRAAKAVEKMNVPESASAVAGSVGTWANTQFGVLTSGQDATLVVKGGQGWTVVGGWWPSLGAAEPALGGHRHVLVIGSDARGATVDRANGDTLQLIGVDAKGGGGILGFARDLWVPIAGGGSGKINSALARGGPQAQVSTISAISGIPIEGYVLAGFLGFQHMVDVLGGVTINAPRKVLSIPKGEVRLNGEGALFYARERKSLPRGDVDRSTHAGVLLKGFATLARLRGILSLPDVLSKIDQNVHSDLTAEQALTLAAWAYRVDPAQVGQRVAAGPMGTSSGGASILRLNAAARQAFADFQDGRL
ncbi:MAG: hypothetical protein CSB46_06020 [Micrococcales bacterium]|nr:MAG: hypothetical protein CSB46_06020 [Micrococcales bacterium]